MKSVVSSTFFEPICVVLNDIFTEANDDCMNLIVKFIQYFVLCARKGVFHKYVWFFTIMK